MIKFADVDKMFQGHSVLKQASFHIKKGEAVGLLGKSGSGKTTILKLISGLILPDAGSVKISSKKIGYIFQEHRLIPWRTVLENIDFGLQASGGTKWAERKERGLFYLEEMGLNNFGHHYPGELSGGMCQRVSIARAFAINPDILLMDEPFSALDPPLKYSLLDITRKMLIHQGTMSVLYVTHNPGELKKITSRIYMVADNGSINKISLNGVEHEIYNSGGPPLIG